MSAEAKVGTFVLASLLVLGAAVHFISTTQTGKGRVQFKTHLRYAGGLGPGAFVLFGGIKVGQVTAVQPWSKDPTHIEVVFKVQAGTPINEDSTARVGMVSLVSSPALSITTGRNDARRLSPGDVVTSTEAVSLDEIAKHIAGVADSANGVMTQLQKEIPAISDQARTLFANLNEISGPRNQKKIDGVLIELNTLVHRESPKIEQITDQISALTKRVDSVVAAIEPLAGNMDRTVTNLNSTVNAVRNPLLKGLDELEPALKQARAVLAGVQDVVGANEESIADAIQNLRATSENLEELTQTLKQRPWNLIRITQPSDRRVPQ
jgi:phospholipid/cholesterol/gamma-HCH transport system substrate-binding protein